MDRQNGQRSHIVADTISRVLAGRGIVDDSVTEEVMEALEEIRVVSYQRRDVVPLLSVAGRVLVLVMEHPDMTMREISVRLGTVESNVQRAIATLAKHGLISRERRGRNNHYRIDIESVLNHPDAWRFLAAIDEHFKVKTFLEADL